MHMLKTRDFIVSFILFFIFIAGMVKIQFEYLGISLLLLFFIFMLFLKKYRYDNDIKRYFYFGSAVCLSLFLGLFHVINIVSFLREYQKYHGVFLLFLFAYLLVFSEIFSFRKLLKYFSAGLLLTTIIGWYNFFYIFVTKKIVIRFATPLGMCNNYAAILVIGVLLFFVLQIKKEYLWSVKIDRAILVFFFISLLATRSDGATLGTFFALLFYWITKNGKFSMKKFSLICFIFLVFFVVGVLFFKSYFLRTGNRVRLGLWKGYAKISLKYPLTGVGLRQMPYHYGEWKSKVGVSSNKFWVPKYDAHNFILQWTAENGIISVLVFLFLLYIYFKNNFSPHNKYYGLYLGLLAFLFEALVSNNLRIIRLSIYFFILAGAYAGYLNKKKENSDRV